MFSCVFIRDYILCMPCQPHTAHMALSSQPIHIICNPVHNLKLAHLPCSRSFPFFLCLFLFHCNINLIIAEYIPPALQILKLLSGPGSMVSPLCEISSSCLRLYSSSQPSWSFVINTLWRISSLLSRSIPKLWYIRRISFPGSDIHVNVSLILNTICLISSSIWYPPPYCHSPYIKIRFSAFHILKFFTPFLSGHLTSSSQISPSFF